MQQRKTKRNNIFIVAGTLLIFFATSYANSISSEVFIPDIFL